MRQIGIDRLGIRTVDGTPDTDFEPVDSSLGLIGRSCVQKAAKAVLVAFADRYAQCVAYTCDCQ